jgi:hypothetical protein
MRVAGIVLLVLGAMMIASSLLKLAVQQPQSIEKGVAQSQSGLDAVIPGGIVAAVGFVLLAMRKPNSVMTAVAVEDWIPVTLTPAAAEFALRAIVDRRFPPGTGLRLERDSASDSFVVKFDAPSETDEDFVGENRGVAVFIEKRFGSDCAGQLIDVIDGRLVVVSAPAGSTDQ